MRRRRPDVLDCPAQATAPSREMVMAMESEYGSGTSQAGRIHGPSAQPPK